MNSFQWHDENRKARYGEGVSHAKKGAKTKPFKLLIRDAQAPPMKWQVHAENKTAAIKYGKARWPNAAIEVVK